jgi:hypothetical protein
MKLILATVASIKVAPNLTGNQTNQELKMYVMKLDDEEITPELAAHASKHGYTHFLLQGLVYNTRCAMHGDIEPVKGIKIMDVDFCRSACEGLSLPTDMARKFINEGYTGAVSEGAVFLATITPIAGEIPNVILSGRVS